jgi:hypothetical protein
VLDTILPVLARPTPVRKTAVFLLSKMVLDFAMVRSRPNPTRCCYLHPSLTSLCACAFVFCAQTARYVRPGSDMYDRVCKLSEEAERLGDSELQQVLANILQTARYVPLQGSCVCVCVSCAGACAGVCAWRVSDSK